MEYKGLLVPGIVRALGRVGWDALGQYVAVEFLIGESADALDSYPMAMTPESARELLLELDVVLSGKAPEGGSA